MCFTLSRLLVSLFGGEKAEAIQGGNLDQPALSSPFPSLAHPPSVESSLLYLPPCGPERRLGDPPAGEQTHLGMDALKSAGRAIIKSPGVPRHTWGTSKHEKLPENWTDTKETLLEGMVFNVKYLGMTLVGQPKGEDMASAAIRRIVATARASAKKFRKVTLTVSPKGIIMTDTETTDLIENVSIYRISYCTADKTQDKVFAYVSQSQFNETLECHAFLCQKKKIAQAVTLTVAQAFKVALDLWEIAQEDKSKKARTCCSCAASKGQTETTDTVPADPEKPVGMEEKLRRPFFSASLSSPSPRSNPTRRRPIKHDSWDVEDGLEDPFSSNMEVEEMDTDWPSPAPNTSLTMQL